MSDISGEGATRIFVDHRELLFSIVYTMLGSVADTEDVLQETWLAWTPRARSGERIDNPRAYLVRVAVNRALARQAGISRRKEEYVGPWLPEPLLTPPGGEPVAGDAGDAVVRAESVSMALLVVLETLTPLERAVFVLHEVFGYALSEIAGILERSPAAVRQVAHRAREHVQARRPRYQADPRLKREATERFLAAVVGGDINALMEILAPDVTMWADGGGKAPAAGLWPVHGSDKVARLIIGNVSRRPIPDLGIRIRQVNGDPSALLLSGDTPYAVIVLDLTADGGRVSGIYAVTNPDKLTRIGRGSGAPEG
ncbi:RNA polymerase sigma factor SigJ [Nonomuraea sp. NPDC000554]|uniref:RNA polymerase sigma factor SigJ n=1 Tax=Nonomuraea sp. NPDC000554 TaxID=3154259 RepID=UPI00332D6438